MRGIDKTIMWDIFDRHSDREMVYEQFWSLGVEAGAIDEDVVMPQLKADAIRHEKHAYNVDRRHNDEPTKQLFEVVKQEPDGGRTHVHKAWEQMSADQQAEAYIREHRKIGIQSDKVAWMYDSATSVFGTRHAREFKQLTLAFPRPETQRVEA